MPSSLSASPLYQVFFSFRSQKSTFTTPLSPQSQNGSGKETQLFRKNLSDAQELGTDTNNGLKLALTSAQMLEGSVVEESKSLRQQEDSRAKKRKASGQKLFPKSPHKSFIQLDVNSFPFAQDSPPLMLHLSLSSWSSVHVELFANTVQTSSALKKLSTKKEHKSCSFLLFHSEHCKDHHEIHQDLRILMQSPLIGIKDPFLNESYASALNPEKSKLSLRVNLQNGTTVSSPSKSIIHKDGTSSTGITSEMWTPVNLLIQMFGQIHAISITQGETVIGSIRDIPIHDCWLWSFWIHLERGFDQSQIWQQLGITQDLFDQNPSTEVDAGTSLEIFIEKHKLPHNEWIHCLWMREHHDVSQRQISLLINSQLLFSTTIQQQVLAPHIELQSLSKISSVQISHSHLQPCTSANQTSTQSPMTMQMLQFFLPLQSNCEYEPYYNIDLFPLFCSVRHFKLLETSADKDLQRKITSHENLSPNFIHNYKIALCAFANQDYILAKSMYEELITYVPPDHSAQKQCNMLAESCTFLHTIKSKPSFSQKFWSRFISETPTQLCLVPLWKEVPSVGILGSEQKYLFYVQGRICLEYILAHNLSRSHAFCHTARRSLERSVRLDEHFLEALTSLHSLNVNVLKYPHKVAEMRRKLQEAESHMTAIAETQQDFDLSQTPPINLQFGTSEDAFHFDWGHTEPHPFLLKHCDTGLFLTCPHNASPAQNASRIFLSQHKSLWRLSEGRILSVENTLAMTTIRGCSGARPNSASNAKSSRPSQTFELVLWEQSNNAFFQSWYFDGRHIVQRHSENSDGPDQLFYLSTKLNPDLNSSTPIFLENCLSPDDSSQDWEWVAITSKDDLQSIYEHNMTLSFGQIENGLQWIENLHFHGVLDNFQRDEAETRIKRLFFFYKIFRDKCAQPFHLIPNLMSMANLSENKVVTPFDQVNHVEINAGLVFIATDRSLEIRDVHTLETRATLGATGSRFFVADWSRGLLISVTVDHACHVWNTNTNSLVAILAEHSAKMPRIIDVKLMQAGDMLMTIGEDTHVKIWSVESGECLLDWAVPHAVNHLCVELDETAQRLLVATNSLYLYDLNDLSHPLAELTLEVPLKLMQLDASSGLLLAHNTEGAVFLWEYVAHPVESVFKKSFVNMLHNFEVPGVCCNMFMQSSIWVGAYLTEDLDSEIMFVDLQAGELMKTLTVRGMIKNIFFNALERTCVYSQQKMLSASPFQKEESSHSEISLSSQTRPKSSLLRRPSSRAASTSPFRTKSAVRRSPSNRWTRTTPIRTRNESSRSAIVSLTVLRWDSIFTDIELEEQANIKPLE